MTGLVAELDQKACANEILSDRSREVRVESWRDDSGDGLYDRHRGSRNTLGLSLVLGFLSSDTAPEASSVSTFLWKVGEYMG